MKRNRLDSRETFPSGMEEYLSFYGWHFSKKMCEWAVSRMKRKGVGGRLDAITPYTMDNLKTIMTTHNIQLQEIDYDALYVANMAKADFYGSSIVDDMHLAKYVKDVIEDPDGYDGLPFTRFYADCIGSGIPIPWEDLV